MAGTIICDFIRTDANQLSLNVGNTTFATINSSGFYSNTGIQLIAANGKISGASVIANSIVTSAVLDSAITQTKLASNVVGTGPSFYAYSSGARTYVGNGSDVKVVLNTEAWDTNSNFDSSTNYRFTPTVAGYYQISIGSLGSFASPGTSGYGAIIIYKNGSAYTSGGYNSSTNGNYYGMSHSNLVYLNGTTDYIEAYINTNNNGTYTFQAQGTISGTFMSGVLVRAA
jgi:hypothetical protein